MPGTGFRQTGLNLLDMLVALLVTGLLLGVVIPGYGRMQEGLQQTAEINRLLAILNVARQQAALLDQPLQLCPALDQDSCQPLPAAGSALLLVDESGTIQARFQSGSVPVAFPAQPLWLRPPPQRGFGNSLLPCTAFRFLPPRGITLSVAGRARIQTDTAFLQELQTVCR